MAAPATPALSCEPLLAAAGRLEYPGHEPMGSTAHLPASRTLPNTMPGVDAAENLGDTFGAPPLVRDLAERLLPIYYQEVRRIARRERRRVQAGETLATTAVIHEAYLRLRSHPGFTDRSHFLRASALAMRHALINHEAARRAAKRGGGARPLPLELVAEPGVEQDPDLLALGEALERLGGLEPRLAQVIECRFFAGFSEAETAEALGLSERTVRRDWIKARAWLYRELAAGQ
jgi:RNA polymerase sigma factor (TIGR02999 family)